MKALTAIALVGLLCTPTLAASPCDGIPEHFDGLGLASAPTIHRFNPGGIRRACDPNYRFENIAGCADEEANMLFLVANRYLRDQGWSEEQIACLEKHETAHLWHKDGTRWHGEHNRIVRR